MDDTRQGSDKSRLSFLDFCAELRNNVYDRCLSYPDPLYVAAVIKSSDTDALYKHTPWTGFSRYWRVRVQQFPEDNLEDPPRPVAPDTFSMQFHRLKGDRNSKMLPAETHNSYFENPSCGHGIPGWSFDFPETIVNNDLICMDPKSFAILTANKTIRHEALSHFLGSNTFIVSRIGSIRAEGLFHETDYHYHDPCGLRLTLHAAKFLNTLGSYMNFLNKLTIDIGTICPTDCGGSLAYNFANTELQNSIDITPFVFSMLKNPGRFEVTVVNTVSSLGKLKNVHGAPLPAQLASPHSTWTCDTTFLARVLNKIHRNPKVIKHKHLIAQVLVHRTEKEVQILYKSTACHSRPYPHNDREEDDECLKYSNTQIPMTCALWGRKFHLKAGPLGKYHACKDNKTTVYVEQDANGTTQTYATHNMQFPIWSSDQLRYHRLPCHILEMILAAVCPDEKIVINVSAGDNSIGPAEGFLTASERVYELGHQRSYMQLVTTFMKNHAFRLVCYADVHRTSFSDFTALSSWLDAPSHFYGGQWEKADAYHRRGQVMSLTKGLEIVLQIELGYQVPLRDLRVGVKALAAAAKDVAWDVPVILQVSYKLPGGLGIVVPEVSVRLVDILHGVLDMRREHGLEDDATGFEFWYDPFRERLDDLLETSD